MWLFLVEVVDFDRDEFIAATRARWQGSLRASLVGCECLSNGVGNATKYGVRDHCCKNRLVGIVRVELGDEATHDNKFD